MVCLLIRPAELQFYTSVSSMLVQIPVSLLLVDFSALWENWTILPAFLLNGLFFHFQSISAYVLMDYISPVTHRYVKKKNVWIACISSLAFKITSFKLWLIYFQCGKYCETGLLDLAVHSSLWKWSDAFEWPWNYRSHSGCPYVYQSERNGSSQFSHSAFRPFRTSILW